jgi:hypothetical protein
MTPSTEKTNICIIHDPLSEYLYHVKTKDESSENLLKLNHFGNEKFTKTFPSNDLALSLTRPYPSLTNNLRENKGMKILLRPKS